MKIFPVHDVTRLGNALECLINEFEGKHTYYVEWIHSMESTFADGTRVVYELNDDGKCVGYMMVHFCSDKSLKINGIHVLPDCQRKGYAKEAFLQLFEEGKKAGYEYVYIQTRLYNKIVLHMFESMNFDVIGKKYHEIEDMYNWVAVYDLLGKNNMEEKLSIAKRIYKGFQEIK